MHYDRTSSLLTLLVSDKQNKHVCVITFGYKTKIGHVQDCLWWYFIVSWTLFISIPVLPACCHTKFRINQHLHCEAAVQSSEIWWTYRKGRGLPCCLLQASHKEALSWHIYLSPCLLEIRHYWVQHTLKTEFLVVSVCAADKLLF